MSSQPTPRLILETLLPPLRLGAAYAEQIQSRITQLPPKEEGDNFFAAALTDADLTIQSLVEVVLLGQFPHIRFYGEEYEMSRNTKYFRAIDLGSSGDYLITLDPIDGTQFYLDGHSNYQIILGVLNDDDFEAVIAISPGVNTYFYALRGQGAFTGSLDVDLEGCSPLQINPSKASVYLGSAMSYLKPALQDEFEVIDLPSCYSHEVQIPNHNGILSGDFTGAVLRAGKFIDGGAIAFIAREAGCTVTTLDGSSLPPLSSCEDYSLPSLIIASSPQVHQKILTLIQA